MKGLFFVGVPLGGLTFLCWDVKQVFVRSTPPIEDRYSIELTAEERSLIKTASVVGMRNEVDMVASAFYRSPSFALERLLLTCLSQTWNSNAELFRSSWDLTDQVAGFFTVTSKGKDSVGLSFKFPGGKSGGMSHLAIKDNSLEFGTSLQNVNPNIVASFLHGIYSRVLIAGCKFKVSFRF